MTETAWGQKYRRSFQELVAKYEDFFCEAIDHEENIERHDWRERTENRKINFDDETEMVEESDEALRYLESTEDFTDDGGCQSEDTKVAFHLSKVELESKANLNPTKKFSKSRSKKKQKTDKDAPVILWFRRDLRTYDNQALVKAVDLNLPIIPVFLWSESEEGTLAAGGATKVWLEQALDVFSETLFNKYNTKLILRTAESGYKTELLKLVQETGARHVVWSELYEPYLKTRDYDIKTGLEKQGVLVSITHGYLLHRPDQVSVASVGAIGIGSVTHFMECCKQNPGDKIGDPLEPPRDMLRPQQWPRSCSLSDLKLYVQPRRKDGTLVDWAADIRRSWRFGEEGGYENLRR